MMRAKVWRGAHMTDIEARTETVAILIQPGPNPEIVVNAVKAAFANLVVIEEQAESKKRFIRRRARKLGWVQALGQLATMVASKYGKRFTTKRAGEILEEFGASPDRDPAIRRIAVPSANSPDFLAAIAEIRPAALLLVSTRMLTAGTLGAIPCPVLNLHAGINPQYRGLQGGYWSRAMGDEIVDDLASVVLQLLVGHDVEHRHAHRATHRAAAGRGEEIALALERIRDRP